MAPVAGSSSEAFFCVASRMKVSERITSSSALIDFSRPTNSGTIMCGKTTMSRSGRTGKSAPRESSNIEPLSHAAPERWNGAPDKEHLPPLPRGRRDILKWRLGGRSPMTVPPKHRERAHEFGNQAEFEEILGLELLEDLAGLALLGSAHLGAEADRAALPALRDDLLQSRERAAADEENVSRVDLQEFLLRMLAA